MGVEKDMDLSVVMMALDCRVVTTLEVKGRISNRMSGFLLNNPIAEIRSEHARGVRLKELYRCRCVLVGRLYAYCLV